MSVAQQDLRTALVYDRVNKWGGAERVLLALHKLFPDAPLFTSVYNSKTAPWAEEFTVYSSKLKVTERDSGQDRMTNKNQRGVITSFIQNFPGAKSAHEKFPVLMPIAFEQFNFDEYDLVISVTSEAAKGIITKPTTRHICYCLTPTRYLWSGYNDYFHNPMFRFIAKPAVSYLKSWDKVAAQRPDTFFAISNEVKKRIKKYYNRDAEIVYPPVYSNLALSSNFKVKNSKLPQKYFLIVSRLVYYKRIDVAIKAFNKLRLPLKIVGIGSEEEKLKKLAGPTIEFLGSLTDDELTSYYRGCTALIFPGHEDFGLTIVEAQMFGKPVIAYRDGGALETIIEGKTGEFFSPQTEVALIETIQRFEAQNYQVQDCLKQADEFTEKKFNTNFMKLVSEVIRGKGKA